MRSARNRELLILVPVALLLTAVFAIQAFVIIGGVTRVIPLTGVILSFISYGGSLIVANFVLPALLLLISNRARREASAPHPAALVLEVA